MRNLKLALILALAVVGIVFVGQNSAVVTVRFFVWELTLSQILLLSAVMLLGFLLGFLVAKLKRRS